MKVDDLIRRLANLRRQPVSPEMVEQARKALAHSSGFVVAKAADIVREKKLDKGCEAKLAIVRALHECEWEEIEVFRKGIRCIQLAGTSGGTIDTGAAVRAAS